mmetsp:Transcript_6482/g.8526  ORF Transcript_6482/g.8526 Transcript_6482/m.8526 type:complete len:221 (-) Transcript_6482:1157-1819(-)
MIPPQVTEFCFCICLALSGSLSFHFSQCALFFPYLLFKFQLSSFLLPHFCFMVFSKLIFELLLLPLFFLQKLPFDFRQLLSALSLPLFLISSGSKPLLKSSSLQVLLIVKLVFQALEISFIALLQCLDPVLSQGMCFLCCPASLLLCLLLPTDFLFQRCTLSLKKSFLQFSQESSFLIFQIPKHFGFFFFRGVRILNFLSSLRKTFLKGLLLAPSLIFKI